MAKVQDKKQKMNSNQLPDGWVEVSLGDICDKIGDGLHGTPEYSVDGEYYFVNGNNIKDGKIIIKTDTKKVDEEEFQKYKKDLGKNTILLSINGTIGNLAEYNNEKCVLGKSAAYLNIKNDVDLAFIYYLMLDNKFQYDISKNANGSTIKNVSLAQLRNYSFNLPPLVQQKAIAEILSSFDDKIELLREQNETLEKIGQEIFKEWFGKYKVGDKLPKGWRVGRLSEIADFLNGLALQKYPPKQNEKNLPVIKIRELKQGVTENTDKANTDLDEKYIIKNGDILFSWSGSLEVVIWKYGKGALNQHLFKISSEEYPKWFYYYWTLYHLKEFKNVAANKATTMGHINRKHLDEAVVFIPDKKTMQKIGKVLSSVLKKIENNNSQIQTLSKTRDALLPKLMKGDVIVN